MSLTTKLLANSLLATGLVTSLVACVGDVGGGSKDRGRHEEGSGSDDERDNENCENLDDPVSISTAADFDKLPAGCWDLYNKLTISGSAITSLAKLDRLIGVNELEIVGTGLTAIDQPIKAYGPVTITSNAQLRDLKNLTIEHADNLKTRLTVDNNAQLATLDTVADIELIDGDLIVTNNPKLIGATFTKLNKVEGAVRVTNNTALTRLDLTQLADLGRLEVTTNPVLGTISGLAATMIRGDVTIRGNRALTSLGTMGSLGLISGALTIDDNDALTTVGAFTTSMHYVTGVVTITGNAALTDLGQVGHMLGIGALTITDNGQLSSCRAVEVAECVSTSGSITIRNNKSANNCRSWCE